MLQVKRIHKKQLTQLETLDEKDSAQKLTAKIITNEK